MATLNFESSMKLLQENVKKLESGDLELEVALKTFEEGVQLIKACQSYLSEAEKRVEILTKSENGGIPATQPYRS